MLDAERCLAVAVFQRAAADLAGRHVISNLTREERFARHNARRWVEEAGPGFRFWSEVAGRDWCRARAALMKH